MHRRKAIFLCDDPANIDLVYCQGRRERVCALSDCPKDVVTTKSFADYEAKLCEVEVIFSTCGMPVLTTHQLDMMPRLAAVFYAAGTVRAFAQPLLDRNITVVSAWAANAIPVAEFTLAQILLSNAGYFANVREHRPFVGGPHGFVGPGNFGQTVAILGAGQIGRKLIELLKSFVLRVIVFDPYLSQADAKALGVTKVSLEQAFAQGSVVSNHLANVPATVGMMDGKLFASMRPHATFINTGRGATVKQDEMLAVLKTRPDLTALLDVIDEDAPSPDSLMCSLPNVHNSAHIAGSKGDELVRMADYVIEEFFAWDKGLPLRYAVTPQMFQTMA